MSTSSALRFPFAISERTGEDTGVVCAGAESDDAVATAATREKEGIGVKAVFDGDDEEAIGVGDGLALDLRELRRGFLSRTRETSCCIRTTLPDIDTLGSWSYKLESTGS
jgi:hypothetical protein